MGEQNSHIARHELTLHPSNARRTPAACARGGPPCSYATALLLYSDPSNTLSTVTAHLSVRRRIFDTATATAPPKRGHASQHVALHSPTFRFLEKKRTHVISYSSIRRQGTSLCEVIKKPRPQGAYRMPRLESLLPHPLFILTRAHTFFCNSLKSATFFKSNRIGISFLHGFREQLINVEPLHIYIILS